MKKKLFNKKYLESDFLKKKFILRIFFGKRIIRLSIIEYGKGVLVWKTSRNQDFRGRVRVSIVAASMMMKSMGEEIRRKRIKICSIEIDGRLKSAGFSSLRSILNLFVFSSRVRINRINFVDKTMHGGTKQNKKARVRARRVKG